MAKCAECGEYENLPYQCRRCGQTFCSEHRLPENHDCAGLGEWNDPGGVFDSGFDDGVEEGDSGGVGSRVKSRIDRETSTGGIMGAFRGNMTYVFLAAMWVTFAAEFAVLFTAGEVLFDDLFVLSGQNLVDGYLWTVVTSVFAHSPFGFFHIAGNSIALYFFGPLVERYLGSKRFTVMFLVTGIVAGLAQIGTGLLLGGPLEAGVYGASGAIMAVMGFLSVVNPNLKVMLLIPPIPLKIRTITLLYAGLSVFGVLAGGDIVGIAHAAHLSGLVLGVIYATVADGRHGVPNQIGSGGGGLGGGRRRF
ncbi:rhomboid family intramembrane serine protease [Halobaculum magnesiiphilum]|uniref:Rhomboid family intramembrane serine protease n=1 Tax=Halobaculum magnesiiphilum TaxID=1017351 RepID=A0A8T8WA89_9EURY|nr:rhomboid family intramembrane serine protease [Halobaculum magnesiiphilum]QZP36741.1 rhomboid family intramembrane serine protease [Halobaculum magnesiiphilum]